ncbi:IMPACT family protein [Haliovirga abyssi]|uniref:Thymidylate synthase n=1 Tax=Haliovirga abyssi TaxID=2996794 RepID=A0AAU9D2S9_9FUSO|nr:YigZ family protein [Haliovirga abyssi]BDU50291.1 thymidylate synthase [Haliovirga abyssi]
MRTIKKEHKIEFEEKKSEFIGYIKPIKTKEEAIEFIEYIREKHKDARHNPYGYRIYSGGVESFKFDDDGEPKNTAGKPIADLIAIRDIWNVVIVVTRYFGGIKLGAGGLIRNYAKAAKLAIEESEIVEIVEKSVVVIDFSYKKINEIDFYLNELKINILRKEFEERVTYTLSATKENIKKLKKINGIIIIEN